MHEGQSKTLLTLPIKMVKGYNEINMACADNLQKASEVSHPKNEVISTILGKERNSN